jgi:SAM-dependent methyltransferase
MLQDPTKRFSRRVENYVKWRPSYPVELLGALEAVCGMRPDWTIADIGSGTGKWTRLLLDYGATVIGVEPNGEMRQAGDTLLAGYANFSSQDGSAEATNLPEASVDLVTVAQAFHWFDINRAKDEFTRILKHPGWAALIWIDRSETSTPFLDAYEQLVRTFATEYRASRHEHVANDDVMGAFFAPHGFQRFVFPYVQEFDGEGLNGRLLSSSYLPLAGEPGHDDMMAMAGRMFAEHQRDGAVQMPYDTTMYVGRLND